MVGEHLYAVTHVNLRDLAECINNSNVGGKDLLTRLMFRGLVLTSLLHT